MQTKQLDKKIKKDAEVLKQDVNTVVDDMVTKASHGISKMTGEAKAAVVGAASSVTKDVGKGLVQYNTKAQKLADKLPGGISKKVREYPWVAISVGMAIGVLMGRHLNRTR